MRRRRNVLLKRRSCCWRINGIGDGIGGGCRGIVMQGQTVYEVSNGGRNIGSSLLDPGVDSALCQEIPALGTSFSLPRLNFGLLKEIAKMGRSCLLALHVHHVKRRRSCSPLSMIPKRA